MTSMSGAALLVAEMVALFLAVTLAVTLLQRRLGDATIRRWMGGPPRRAALKGIAVGFITPFCTYSAIPVLVGMRQAGVRPAGYAAFIFAAPVVDPVMIGVLAIIIGPAGAAVYLTTAFAAASPAPTTRWPFPPRPPRAFPSTSAPNSSFPSATPSTPKERAPDPSSLSSSRAPEPTSPSSPCSPRWPGAVS